MTTSRTRRLRWLLPATLALALIIVGGVAWARSDDRPRARVGEVFDPAFQTGEVEGGVDVVLPWVYLTVAVGPPRDELPDALGAEPNVQEPDGGSFVPVQVVADSERLIPVYVDSPGFEGRAELTLLDGDRRYPITHVPGGFRLDPAVANLVDAQRYVAVEGSPDEWSLEVEYDGVTWAVDLSDGSTEPGPQDWLLEQATVDEQQEQPALRCGAPVWTRGYRPEERYNNPVCRVIHQQRVPYVDGLGWAEPGREFLVVQVQSREPGHASGPGGAHYLVRTPVMSYRLDGEEPLAVANVDEIAGPLALQQAYDPEQAIFDVAADDERPVLRVRQSYRGEASDPGDRQGPRINIDWRLPLEGARG